ncbi:winged helix-turn-helix domain-containing protein [Micromonospora sp. WMMD1102]|uniref:winged helix-turn-helix domain-containing protein n=1 Tax=Micromonospora sp. WMMD1102 TaxID=3016105 RepID=UPI0024157C28|nr:winged helix-turn-helix domain-containing protein [Micromonospora sp. WMMD1102]MDG4785686.1 winged helix-turn-helix domain-containing protein [Micromonospora sp. WMMD1102]MDG4792159.1 winged helix-turn-helix domain-containing protein [Micromonospora sp. WMMD1102]
MAGGDQGVPMPVTKWEKLANHIRNQVQTGELKPGDKLPSTAQLKAEHDVSDAVIRYAMHALRTEGLVESVHGVGVFVAQPK